MAAGGGGEGGRSPPSYMAALHDIKPGPTDRQRADQAAQRQQLKRDLEEQIQERREAAARAKAAEAEAEEREEARLRAYWAAQQTEAQAAAQAAEAAMRHHQPQHQHQHQQRQTGGAGAQLSGRGGIEGSRREAAAVQHGGAGRGEPLMQPGVTVLPQRAQHAQQAQQTVSSDRAGESAQREQQTPPPPDATELAASRHQLLQLLQLHLQHEQRAAAAPTRTMTAAQAAAILAAAAAAAVSTAPATLPWLHPHLAGLQPPKQLEPLHAAAPASANAAVTLGDSQQQQLVVLELLREVQAEQWRMRGQLEAAVSRLRSSVGAEAAASAHSSERDRTRSDLERVQRLLAGQQQYQQCREHESEDLQAVTTTHVLPLGARRIPSRLGTPALDSANAQPCPRQQQHAQQRHRPLNLPARYRLEAIDPWQQRTSGAAATVTPAKQVAAPRGVWGRPPRMQGRPGAGMKSKSAAAQHAKGWRNA